MDKRSILFIVLMTACLFFVNRWFSPSVEEKKETPQEVVQVTQEAPALPEASELPKETKEQFYVLENDFQQIVFSTIGGAITEINLPFKSAQNSHSLVLPIEFDEAMKEEYPSNDHFPSTGYLTWENEQKQPKEIGTLGGYYPLLRRTLIGNRSQVLYKLSPKHYAFNLFSDGENLHMAPYAVTRFEKDLIEFEYKDAHRRIIKTFSLASATTPYCFQVTIRGEGDTRGLWMTTGVPEVELISGNFTPAFKYLLRSKGKPQVESLSAPKTFASYSSIHPEWLSNSNGFLGLIIQPLSEVGSGFQLQTLSGSDIPTKLSLIDAKYDLYPADKYPGYEFKIPLRTLTKEPTSLRIFAGPYQDTLLKTLDAKIGESSENPYFALAMSFQGWFTFISEPFAKFLFILMKFFYFITHSWGFSIIFLTIALRLMLYPLNGWSIKSSIKMQQIAPKVAALQEKHKKDPKQAQMAMLMLYREAGVNPLTGCLPILIQIPFLIGMFDLLKSVFELRGASFIPGWIPNLTAPDVVFSWNYPIFFFGTDFHLLPFLLGAVMFLQQRFAASLPKNPALMTDQQRQQKVMGNIMTIVFTVMFYHFPSGLNLYWLSSMALGIAQQWFTTKQLQKKPIKKTN